MLGRHWEHHLENSGTFLGYSRKMGEKRANGGTLNSQADKQPTLAVITVSA